MKLSIEITFGTGSKLLCPRAIWFVEILFGIEEMGMGITRPCNGATNAFAFSEVAETKLGDEPTLI